MRIVLRNVGHRFASNILFSNRTLTFEPGLIYALVGPSGSGKSTLLAILAGMLDPAEGSVDRDQVDDIYWVFQTSNGVANRSALDHVVLPLLAKGASRPDAEPNALEILRTFGLEEAGDLPFKALSGGQAQRLMLARAVARDPRCLLVDEPTAQLDRHSAAAVSGSLLNLRSRGRIVIVATHDAQVIEMCDSLVDLGGQ
ncbi:ABC transporter ATP-binding protein [Agromyces italicus]|uniref:ABC transporter ATP-binding protein n=1 Tax=Agromyces italicus TaxID=279572 RepID=UPI0003B7ACB7|nr:ABC transporter ATP-binding protein [Agromyces italicus]